MDIKDLGNPEDFKKYWVWDGECENPKETKRCILGKLGNKYLAVADGHEETFLNGVVFSASYWQNTEEIKEEKTYNYNRLVGEVITWGNREYSLKVEWFNEKKQELKLSDESYPTIQHLENIKVFNHETGEFEPFKAEEER